MMHLPEALAALIFRLLLVVLVMFGTVSSSHGEDKPVIGAVEEVILLPWGIKIPARIDTGAAFSSLDVCEIKKVNGKEIEFLLPERCGGLKIRLPVAAWKYVRSTEGPRERRPVVLMDVCIGTERIRTEVTLNDRSKMEFPLLLGRKTLRGKFVVDVSRTKILPPTCLKDQSP